MVNQTSNAGPFEVGPDNDIANGETVIIDTKGLNAGPRNKKGGLKKFYGERGGFDYVQIVNGSDEIIEVDSDGGTSQPVPPATTVILSGSDSSGDSIQESTQFTQVSVTNTGVITAGAIQHEKVGVLFGNNTRPEEGSSGGLKLDPLTAIPGITR